MKTTLSKCLLGLVVALILGLSATIVLISNDKTQVNAISDHVALNGVYDMTYNAHYTQSSVLENGVYVNHYQYYSYYLGYNNDEGVFPTIDNDDRTYDMGSYELHTYSLGTYSFFNYNREFLDEINTIAITFTYLGDDDYEGGYIQTLYNGTTYMEISFYYVQDFSDSSQVESDVLNGYRSFRLRVQVPPVLHRSNVTLTFTNKELGYTLSQFLNPVGYPTYPQGIGFCYAMTNDLYTAYSDNYYDSHTNFLTPTIQLYSLPIEDVIVQNGYSEQELQEYGDSKYAEGYIYGEDSGLIRGYEDGYEQGYSDGYHDGSNGETPLYNHSFASVLSTAWTSASNLLQTPVFGNLTILHLILIPLVLGVLLIILKLIRG